eukprot:g783.t1
MNAVFGFCDIRNFTDATEVLQSDVMIFVNEIAQVVHEQVHKYAGVPNKNIGDAFLLIWKRDAGRVPMEAISGSARFSNTSSYVCARPDRKSPKSIDVKEEENLACWNNTADQALVAMLKIIVATKTNANLLKYSSSSDPLGKVLQSQLPGYSVRMGLGLHIGWAIEGAIGSHHKIDASYLSPHVNLASRLEAATKQKCSSLASPGGM